MRASGVLMPIFSLPSKYGIGTLGREAKNFIDFLKKSGQSYWQILPIAPTGYGDSPYQSYAGLAGNPYFIDLELLCQDGYLLKKECEAYNWDNNSNRIDYSSLYQNRFQLLRKAYRRMAKNLPLDYEAFLEQNKGWLNDYALFMVLKNLENNKEWKDWKNEWKYRDPEAIAFVKKEYKNEIAFYCVIQYFFFQQWSELKAYANKNGVSIIGDMPIYVAYDSVDVWRNPELFALDEELVPTMVSGCPPDAFTEEGQLWGNPLYDWKKMKQTGYSWWKYRLAVMMERFDVIRIDHFRGFDSYYAIPYGAVNAQNGVWEKGPGMEFFQEMKYILKPDCVIAEDLGFLTGSVRKLLEKTGFAGMKILQFAFDGKDSEYLPHKYPKNCVAYTGTHDNQTSVAWYEELSISTKKYASEYMQIKASEGINWGMIRSLFSSKARYVIIPMQDILGLSDTARINQPSTVGSNWGWRMEADAISSLIEQKLYQYTKEYKRIKS